MAHPAGNAGIDGLGPRVISSLVLAPTALAISYVGGISFGLLTLAAAGVMAYEWNRLCNDAAPRTGAVFIAVIVGAVGAAALGAANIALLAVVPATVMAFAVAWVTGARRWWSAVGVVYIAIPCISMIWLRHAPAQGLETIFWLFAVVWATDTGAYFAGRGFGGPRLAPRISPKKTWAGLVGGIASAFVVGAVTARLLDGPGAVPLVVLSCATAVAAQAGDLWESWVKRHFSVKDTGGLIPGHGGLLDRLDGLMTAAPAVAAVVLLDGGSVTWR